MLKSPAAVSVPGGAFDVAVSADGRHVYATVDTDPGFVRQFDVGADGALTPKSPATVAAGRFPSSVTVTPLPVRPFLPTSKDQCKHSGWRNYGVFKNQGDCVNFVETGGKKPPAGS